MCIETLHSRLQVLDYCGHPLLSYICEEEKKENNSKICSSYQTQIAWQLFRELSNCLPSIYVRYAYRQGTLQALIDLHRLHGLDGSSMSAA